MDDEKFDIDREEIIDKIEKAGVTKLISAGYSLEGSKKAVELAQKYDFDLWTEQGAISAPCFFEKNLDIDPASSDIIPVRGGDTHGFAWH